MDAYTSMYLPINMDLEIHGHAYTHPYVRTYVQSYIHAHTHTYIHTYIYTYVRSVIGTAWLHTRCLFDERKLRCRRAGRNPVASHGTRRLALQ
jgi:hypothetical protein